MVLKKYILLLKLKEEQEDTDQQIKNNTMEYTTGGHETMTQYLQDNNYYHTT